MQAILLATDETTKLRPLTERVPAPMVSMVDRPVVARTIELLARHGIKHAWVSLFRLPGCIESYVGDGRRWGVQIEYLLQRESWGTAGALKWAAHALLAGTAAAETILVLPADVVLDLDIAAALAYHRQHGAWATAIVADPERWARSSALPEGAGVRLAGDGRIGAAGSPAEGNVSWLTGAYLFEAQVLDLIPPRTRFDCGRDLLPLLLSRADGPGRGVFGYVVDGYWNPLDSFAAYQHAQSVYLRSAWQAGHDYAALDMPAQDGIQPDDGVRVRYPTLDGLQIAPGIWVGHNYAIHPSARLAAPVYIGANCQVGREVELGPHAVLGADVIVDEEATVRGSAVLDHTYVGRLVNVAGRVVDRTLTIDVATGESTTIVDRFLLSATTPASPGSGAGRWIDGLAALLLLVLTLPITFLSGLVTLLSSLAAGQGLRVFSAHPVVGRRVGAAAGGEAALPPFGVLHFATRRSDGGFTTGGRFLERWELDGLPALWNVLVGDMRLVGVKPLSPAQAARLVEDWQHARFEYPAGFTGLWYVQAGRAADLDAVTVADAYYVATRHWREDLRLLWQTPGAWFRRVRS